MEIQRVKLVLRQGASIKEVPVDASQLGEIIDNTIAHHVRQGIWVLCGTEINGFYMYQRGQFLGYITVENA